MQRSIFVTRTICNTARDQDEWPQANKQQIQITCTAVCQIKTIMAQKASSYPALFAFIK